MVKKLGLLAVSTNSTRIHFGGTLDDFPTMTKFSLVVCTYNRPDYLLLNLQAISEFNVQEIPYEVLVVDNGSADVTSAIVKKFVDRIPNLRYIFEEKQGLSYARNRGYRESLGEYVIYLDDDAIPYPDFMERVDLVERNYGFDAWGGKDIPYFPEGRPPWLKSGYVSVALNYRRVTRLRSHDFFNGGIMVLKKNVLESFGGFNPGFGMQGNKIGYAEETELQIRMKKAGLHLGFDPEWKIKHCILPHKLNVAWFFDYSFAMGRNLARMYGAPKNFFTMLNYYMVGFVQMIVLMVKYTPRLLLDKEYFIENWLIDVFRKFAKRMGMIYYVLTEDRQI